MKPTILLLLLLSGCATADYTAIHQEQCTGFGFKNPSAEFSKCMLSLHREQKQQDFISMERLMRDLRN